MTTYDTGAALLAAIIAHPAEDDPRLRFADWCEENGDPGRAEFIRRSFDPPGPARRKRMRKLLGKGFQHWWPAALFRFPGTARREQYQVPEDGDRVYLYGMPGDCAHAHITFARGFPFRFRSSGESWLRHHAALRAAAPFTEVELTTRVRRGGGPDPRPMTLTAGAATHTYLNGEEESLSGAVTVETSRPWTGCLAKPLSKVLAEVWPGITFEVDDEDR